MADSEIQATVVIKGESFSIVEVPDSNTQIVVSEKQRLLGSIDLQALVTDLSKVGNCVRIAYNGVAGYTELQIKIRDIGYNVTKLCNKSAVTVSKFKQASGSILGDLQGTYQFLLDGFEDLALDTLHAISEVAKDMAHAADELHKEFDEESKRVEGALKETMTKKGEETDRKKSLEEDGKKFKIEKEKASDMKKTAEEDFHLYEEKYRVAEEKQESFEASASSGIKQTVNFVSKMFTGGRAQLFDLEGEAMQAQQAREEKLKHLEEMKKQRDIRSRALQDIAEFAKKIEDCKDDSELAQVAISALHSAMGGLQDLSAMMMKAALFWKQMQVHCEQLAKDKMQRMIKTVMKKPQEERLKVWTADSFKIQAIKYYAQWVALDDVCSVYMGRIQQTQKDLFTYLTENPTLKEARKNVRELAVAFRKDLETERKAIAEKEFASEEEIKQLKEQV